MRGADDKVPTAEERRGDEPLDSEPVGPRLRLRRSICQHVNDNYNVDGVGRSLSKRLQALVDAEGGRITTNSL